MSPALSLLILSLPLSLLLESHVDRLGVPAGVPSTIIEVLLELIASALCWQHLGIGLRRYGWIPFLFAVGDFTYGLCNYWLKLPAAHHPLCLTYVLPYMVSMALILDAMARIVRIANREGSNLTRPLVISCTCALFLCTAAITWPALQLKVNGLSPFFSVLTVAYTALESCIIGTAIVLLASVVNLTAQIALLGILFMHTSDIALRYQSVHPESLGMSYFESGWLLGVALLAAASLRLKSQILVEQSAKILTLPLSSIRGMTIGVVFLSSLLVLATTEIINGRTQDAITASTCLIIASLSFCISLVATNTVTWQLSLLLRRLGAGGTSWMTHGTARLPSEISSIVNEFARLQTLIETEKNSTLRLASQVVHDLGTPNMVMKMMVASIQEDLSKQPCDCKDRLHDPLEGLTLAAKGIQHISNNLLGTRKKMLDIMPLKDSTQEAISLARRSHPERTILLESTITEDGPQIEGFSRILLNLINNSIDASTPGDAVLIRMGKINGAYTVAVKDRGTGIPDEVLQKIENGEPTTTKNGGNGLGLSSMVEWSKKAGHSYSITSSKSQGTEITVRIAGGA